MGRKIANHMNIYIDAYFRVTDVRLALCRKPVGKLPINNIYHIIQVMQFKHRFLLLPQRYLESRAELYDLCLS